MHRPTKITWIQRASGTPIPSPATTSGRYEQQCGRIQACASSSPPGLPVRRSNRNHTSHSRHRTTSVASHIRPHVRSVRRIKIGGVAKAPTYMQAAGSVPGRVGLTTRDGRCDGVQPRPLGPHPARDLPSASPPEPARCAGSAVSTTNIPALVVPVVLPRPGLMFSPRRRPATAATRHIQLGMGVLVLSVCRALIAVRFWVRRRVLVPLQAATPPPARSWKRTGCHRSSSPFAGMEGGAEGESAIRRRFQSPLNSPRTVALCGSLWCAAWGLYRDFRWCCSWRPPVVSSGATTGAQIASPSSCSWSRCLRFSRSQSSVIRSPRCELKRCLQPVHDWALANRRQVMIGIFTVMIGGRLQVVKGLGVI